MLSMGTCPTALKDIITLVERWKLNGFSMGLSKRLHTHLTSVSHSQTLTNGSKGPKGKTFQFGSRGVSLCKYLASRTPVANVFLIQEKSLKNPSKSYCSKISCVFSLSDALLGTSDSWRFFSYLYGATSLLR